VDTAGLRAPATWSAAWTPDVLQTIKALSGPSRGAHAWTAAKASPARTCASSGSSRTRQRLPVLGEQVDRCVIDPKEPRLSWTRPTSGLEFMAYAPILPVSVLTGYNLRRVFP